MSTHNICFRQEIRRILCGYPLLSVSMVRLREYAMSAEPILFAQESSRARGNFSQGSKLGLAKGQRMHT